MMILLYVSLVANIALAALLVTLFLRARQRIIDEKVATFGGCIAAISLGLLREDRQRGTDALVEGLRRMRGGLIGEDIKYHLIRAAGCRLSRNDMSFDLIGEAAHVAAPVIYPNTEKHEAIANYIHDLDYAKGQPKDLFVDSDLLLAEIHEEKALLKMYRASIGKPNPFKNLLPSVA
jgi:hypothetical protein